MHSQLLSIWLLVGFIACNMKATQAAERVPEAKLTAAETILEAQKLVTERDRMGKRLIAILQDDNQQDKLRIEAAHQLGRLQYMPAIDLLIENIAFVDQNHFSLEPNTAVDYPLTTALAGYGTAAVPALVEAILTEKDPKREHLLFYPIMISKTSEVALRYLRGRETPENPDVIYRNNFQQLQEILLEVIDAERARK